MPLTLNREARKKLFDEDLAWLRSQSRTLERDHVEQVIRWAMARCGVESPAAKEVVGKLKSAWRDQLNIGAAPSVLREAFELIDRLLAVNLELAKACGCLDVDEYGRSCCEPPCIACLSIEDARKNPSIEEVS